MKLVCFGTLLRFTFIVEGGECTLRDSDGKRIGEAETTAYGKRKIVITKDSLLQAGDRFEVHI